MLWSGNPKPKAHEVVSISHPLEHSMEIRVQQEQIKPSRKYAKKAIPDDFGVSEGVTRWALEKNIPAWALPLHLEYFVGYVQASGKRYVSYDAALRNAISANWAKLNYAKLEATHGPGAEDRRQAAIAVFGEWQKVHQKHDSMFSTERQQLIMQRLVEGYSIERLIQAVHGIKKSAWHMGGNKNGSVFDDLAVILRDGAQVEKFSSLETSSNPLDALNPAARATLSEGMKWLARRNAERQQPLIE
jgi:hypothetical protein